MNLAFIGSESEASQYGSIINRIDGARWFAFVPLDGSRSSAGKDALEVTIEEESIEALLKNHSDEVDAFVVDAQPGRLRSSVKEAGPAGKPILAGPLLARTREDLDSLSMELEQGLLFPACPWRFIPAIQSVKASIDAGKLGEIGLIRMHRWNSKATHESDDIPDRMIPAIDIATWFFGEQPRKVFSLKSSSISDYIQLHLQFEGDGMVVIDDTTALPEGGDYFSLTVIGGRGAAYADDHRNMNLIVDGVHPHAVRTEQGAIHIARQLQEFVNTVNNASPPGLAQDVSNVLQVSDAVLETMAVNQVAVWKDGKYECE